MKKKFFTKIKNKQKGAAMLVSVIFFLFISVAIVGGLVSPTLGQYKIANTGLHSAQAYYLAESGTEDAFYRILNNQPIGSSEVLTLGNNSTTTTITNLGSDQKKIESLGDSANFERKNYLKIITGSGASFNYGVQAGQGGLYLDSGIVYGNVYSNGPITASGSGSNLISGTAISANSPSLVADQENGSGTPSNNYSFGNSNSNQDLAQSFVVSDDLPINKVSLYLKKVGNPSNATVRIVNNLNIIPGTNTLASGTLLASAVTSSYGWIDISLSTNPLLLAGTTYWLVIDCASSNNNYYTIGLSGNTYSSGVVRAGKYTDNYSWATIVNPVNPDSFFKIYLGGVLGLISGNGQWNKVSIGGDVKAHNVSYVNAGGNIYCQVGTLNNKLCNTGEPDPVYIQFPISESNIDLWKDEALAGGINSGNYSVGWAGATLGPKKIIGNLSVSGGGTLTVVGPLWVTGNLTLNGGGTIKLSSNYGQNDGIIIVDGTISVSGGGNATGSGTTGSYLMLVSLSSATNAATINGGAGAMVIYAPYGTVNISGGASLKEATGYKINISGGASLTYETGLANMNFSTGPSGAWNLSSWQEIK